jgi:hypothetical protein
MNGHGRLEGIYFSQIYKGFKWEDRKRGFFVNMILVSR